MLIYKIINFFRDSKKENKELTFFDFSPSEQKRIIKDAVNEANDEQIELIRRYEKKHGKIDINKFVRCED